MSKISLGVGAGGKSSYNFINKEILSRFNNDIIAVLGDGANIEEGLVVTTDTFTVFPPFFDGGNIGVLAFCGMVNDLASMGAEPVYMTMALVIEEGFAHDWLTVILDDLKRYAEEFNVKLIAGDTKVVEKGAMDGIHINMTGIGRRRTAAPLPSRTYKNGDKIIVTGPVGEHTIAVLKVRGVVSFEGEITSDVAPLWPLVNALIKEGIELKFIRDITRGGMATVLNELSIIGKTHLVINEDDIPKNPKVSTLCDIYGFDIFSLACEGRMILVIDAESASASIDILKRFEIAQHAAVIGEVRQGTKSLVTLRTSYGGETIMDMPMGEILPRIC